MSKLFTWSAVLARNGRFSVNKCLPEVICHNNDVSAFNLHLRWTLWLSSSGINSSSSRRKVRSENVAFTGTVGSVAVQLELNNIEIYVHSSGGSRLSQTGGTNLTFSPFSHENLWDWCRPLGNPGVCSFSWICDNFHLNSKKLRVQTPQKVKFEMAISLLKHEKRPSTFSTKSGAHSNFAKF